MKDGGKILYFDPIDAMNQTDKDDTREVQAPYVDFSARETLAELVRLLTESGFDPVTQLTGYLIADDPTYLPEDGDARALARRVGRDKLLTTLLNLYLTDHPISTDPQA